MKKTIKPVYLFLAFFGVFVLGVGVYYLFFEESLPKLIPILTDSPTPQPTVTQDIKTFKSNLLDFEIDVPQNFKIHESHTAVELEGSGGIMLIGRNGTQFDSLNDYLLDFDKTRNITIIESGNLVIGNLEAISRIEFFPNRNVEQKTYNIFTGDGAVYFLDTKDRSLYDDLDQVSKSFRYVPD